MEVTNYDVTLPEAPEAPAPVKVDIHYYTMTTTPTPVTPQVTTPVAPASVLPSTGEASSALSVVGGLILSALGLIGARKRKED